VLKPVEVSGSFGTVPIMIMDYAGTLTVLLYFVFFRMTLGDIGALMATALLAVDPMFVIPTVLDWGNDAVQHFLAAAALVLFLTFHRCGEG